MMPRTVNCLLAVRGPERQIGRSPRGDSGRRNPSSAMIESGCARNTSGSSIDRFVAAVEVVVAKAAVASHVDAEHSRLPLAGDLGIDDGLDHGHGDAHRCGAPARVSRTSSLKPVSPAVTCSSVFPAMRSTVRRRRRARSDWPCACRRTPRRRARCPPSSASCGGRACESTAKLMRRSRISRARLRVTSSTIRPSRSAIVRAQLSRHLHIVRDDDDRRAEACVQIANEAEDVFAGVRVEIAGRLVGEQNRRIDRQRACDRDALPFAAGQLVRQMIRAGARAGRASAARAARSWTFARASRGGAAAARRSRGRRASAAD